MGNRNTEMAAAASCPKGKKTSAGQRWVWTDKQKGGREELNRRGGRRNPKEEEGDSGEGEGGKEEIYFLVLLFPSIPLAGNGKGREREREKPTGPFFRYFS